MLISQLRYSLNIKIVEQFFNKLANKNFDYKYFEKYLFEINHKYFTQILLSDFFVLPLIYLNISL